MDPLLTIQIPTYRNVRQLGDTLASLLTHTEYPMVVRLINNDPISSPHIHSLVEQLGVKNVEIVEAGGNKGWMGAHNMALPKCDTPYVCLLNDDVVFLPEQRDFWRKLCGWLMMPEVGAVGPSSNFVMGSQNLWNINHPHAHETTLLIGFCVVMKTDVIKDVGGLDETLPGGDDFDWSIRIRDAGYRLIVDRSAFLFHIGQQTGRRVHGAAWDSVVHQENTINALVRKHGVKKWYDTQQAKVFIFGQELDGKNEEDVWIENIAKSVEGQTGLNLGVGSQAIAGYGLDIARKGERGAGGRKFEGAEPEITGDASKLPVADSSLDYIIAAHLFEHMLNPVKTLVEWKRVLKPGGAIYAVVPEHGKLDTMIIDYTHVHAYTPDSLQHLLEALGWNVEGCQEFNTRAFGITASNGRAAA